MDKQTQQTLGAFRELGWTTKQTAMPQVGSSVAGQAISKHSEIEEQFSAIEILMEESECLASRLMEKIYGILDMMEYPATAEKEQPVALCRSQLGGNLQNLALKLQSNNRRFKDILNRVQL
jgi:hypothetical protein